MLDRPAIDADPALDVERIVEGGTVFLVLSGEVDLVTAGDLEAALERELSTPRVVVDVAGVAFLNSTGLGTLVAATRHMREHGGELVVRGLQEIPLRAVTVTGLDGYLSLAPAGT